MRRTVTAVLALALLLGCCAAYADGLTAGDVVSVERVEEYVTLRAAPSTKAEALDKIPLHARVEVLADVGDGFALVSYEGWTGYVLTKYLDVVYPAREGLQTGCTAVVANCNEYVTLRAWPSTQADALATLPLGTEVNFVAHDEDGFALVDYFGESGYVLERYLEPMETYSGDPLSLSEAERTELDRYLSVFSEAGFTFGRWCYDSAAPKDQMLISFGVDYVWFHQQDVLEWTDDNTVRAAEEYVVAAPARYLGKTPADYTASYYVYDDGYFYWEETGGHIKDGYAILDSAEDLGDGRVAVRFHIYGGGMYWEGDPYGQTTEEAAALWGRVDGSGFAVVNTGEGGLADSSGWTLERYALAR